jgi:hypothetical protein
VKIREDCNFSLDFHSKTAADTARLFGPHCSSITRLLARATDLEWKYSDRSAGSFRPTFFACPQLESGLDLLPKTHRLRQPSIRRSPSNERNPWLVWTQLLIARVVLFDDVIQVETGSTSAPTPQFLLPLKFRDHFWV